MLLVTSLAIRKLYLSPSSGYQRHSPFLVHPLFVHLYAPLALTLPTPRSPRQSFLAPLQYTSAPGAHTQAGDEYVLEALGYEDNRLGVRKLEAHTDFSDCIFRVSASDGIGGLLG
jgi:hypothetical protein